MGLLTGDGAALFSEILGPIYVAARIVRNAPTYAPNGDLQNAQTEATCRAQVDAATYAMRKAEGYAATDRAVYVLAGTIDPPGPLEPDDLVQILEGPHAGSEWSAQAPVERDPCGAAYLARAAAQGGA